MSTAPGIDWEDAFANADYIADGEAYPDKWAARAEAFRAACPGTLDLPYGDHPRERLDLFYPKAPPKGLAMIVHGGYWLAFDKSSWSDLAAGALNHGWAVAMPSYALAPEAPVAGITAQIGRALAAAADRVAGPIRLAGHSAGGHLATRMACECGPLAPAVARRIDRVVSISGLHDLRPLLLHSMNEKLRLTPRTAAAESAALCAPLPGIKVIAWVGALERPEFLRQSALLAEAWGRAGVDASLVADPGKHHFDVIDGLKDPDHLLCQGFAGE
ncbi:MAG: alpha/beta hydrolase fold domain-containing protein [Boseongicola sp. SB0664_bin_43]|uniref:Alpha/beta hydrolase fold domain-containing protein n=1 Tax=Boseongicola sp. SB0664_bin_43 TaxID=2604844 RepID=A0A6B0Y1I6_9RHOB|nr:alpha/beta hydrolase fold domain-containing protein [Boseongicola sp. SB0664_bin_43]